MITTNKIHVYLHQNGEYHLDAVQGDTARTVELVLYAGPSEWTLPSGTSVQFRFQKPDRTGGTYDTMPDGSCAYEIDGNRVKLALAPQVLTVPGEVKGQAVLLWGDGELATFTIKICVQENPALGVLESEDFVNLSDWVSAQVKSYLKNEQDELREIFATPGALFVNVAYSADSDTGYVSDKTYEEIYKAAPGLGSALDGERPVYCVLWSAPTFSSRDYVILPLSSHDPVLKQYIFTRMDNGLELSVHISETATWVKWWPVARKADIPKTLPNPQALTINGQVYDGSEPVEVNLEGVSGQTPFVGENGNWWVGEEDTGVKAAGEDGRSVWSVELNASQSDESKSVYSMTDDGDRTIGSFTVYHGKDGEKGDSYILTAADKAEIAQQVEGVTIVQPPKYVESVEKMTDTERLYVLISTGRIWANAEKTVVGTKTKACDDGYTYPENSRLGSDGSVQTSDTYAGYTITPFIDLLAHPVPFMLHVDGMNALPSPYDNYSRLYLYTDGQAKAGGGPMSYTEIDNHLNVSDSDVTKESADSLTILFDEVPTAADGTAIRYIRLSGAVTGTPKVYVTYEAETTGVQWFDTGTTYAPALTDEEKQEIVDEVVSRIDTELLSVIGSGEVV